MMRPGLAMFEEVADPPSIRVTVGAGDRLAEGEADLETELGRPFALAKATLAASADFAGLAPGFELVEARVVDLVTGDVAVVTCTVGPGQSELLAGAAPIRSDGWEKAICRAALDAVNRYLVKE